MQFVLKILSGSLNGVEYTLSGNETVFHVGPQQDLVNGKAAQLLGSTENAYFLPAEQEALAFVIQCTGEGASLQLRVGERQDEQAPWAWRPLVLQQPSMAAGIHFAVRPQADAWASDVLDFVPPALPTASGDAQVPGSPRLPARRRTPMLLAGGVALLLVATTAAWFYWHHLPETRVRGLASVLNDAPVDFDIVAGDQGRLFVFADTAADKAWAERASRRLQRRDDIHLVRHEEVARLEQRLLGAGLDLVVVRLDQPARPEVVLSGAATAAEQAQARKVLEGQLPWQHELRVSTVSDQQLIELARQTLRVRGISSRVDPQGSRASVVNDVFLDDVALNDMTSVAASFHQRWGMRRISIQPRLWDDLLQGRSYRYSPGQLLSIGSGRWDYAGAAGSAVH